MSEIASTTTAAERYDTALRRGRNGCLPVDVPRPQPTTAWPPENVALLERYYAWQEVGGFGYYTIRQVNIPMAGHVLGLALKPHRQLDLAADLEAAMAYIRAKQLSAQWTKTCAHALERFRHFLLEERGVVAVRFPAVDVARYQEGLPSWLVEQLTQLQHLRQANWRASRLENAIRCFWSQHTRIWRWLAANRPFAAVTDIRRRHIFDYVDERLATGRANSTINQDIRGFQATLRFLQEREVPVPQALLRLPGLKQPDSLPRFLTDEQVNALRVEMERRVAAARTRTQERDTRLDRAAFYLLWQGGLRVGEVEELQMEDLNLGQQQLVVRQGKGMQDRAVYLTEAAVLALLAYLAVRGEGQSDHVFLYRRRPLGKDLVRNRLRAAGERVGVKVTPHRLRHTYATQLVNAGCRVTSIQALLGHRRLNTTMTYTRVHDHTVVEDYYRAMAIIEAQLEPEMDCVEAQAPETSGGYGELLALVEALQAQAVGDEQRALVEEVRRGLLALAEEE